MNISCHGRTSSNTLGKGNLSLFSTICAFQEPILSSGYICEFSDLEIKSVLLDEIMKVQTELIFLKICFSNTILKNFCKLFSRFSVLVTWI